MKTDFEPFYLNEDECQTNLVIKKGCLQTNRTFLNCVIHKLHSVLPKI